jgi:uncharacterized membrane protein YhaH (DUF805 family)
MPVLAVRAGANTLVVVGLLAVLVLGVLLALVTLVMRESRKARRAGYASFWAYLAATPKTDAEKRAAADLALKGVVVCFLGLLFPPLILVGLVPLYFGARKVIHVSMGLGLVDDIDLPGA